MEYHQSTVDQHPAVQHDEPRDCPIPLAKRTLLARLGMTGLLFFLIKGLLWLAAPYVLFVVGFCYGW